MIDYDEIEREMTKAFDEMMKVPLVFWYWNEKTKQWEPVKESLG